MVPKLPGAIDQVTGTLAVSWKVAPALTTAGVGGVMTTWTAAATQPRHAGCELWSRLGRFDTKSVCQAANSRSLRHRCPWRRELLEAATGRTVASLIPIRRSLRFSRSSRAARAEIREHSRRWDSKSGR